MGSQHDMKLLKNHLSLVYPSSFFLCSRWNEDRTNGDIEEMGVNLAKELQSFISEIFTQGNKLGKISFIGYSLGGVIIRAAMPHLSEYKDKMHTFISLSSPHLGYMYNSSKIVNAGLWILKQYNKSICLNQLHLSDSGNLKCCYLSELAKSVNFK